MVKIVAASVAGLFALMMFVAVVTTVALATSLPGASGPIGPAGPAERPSPDAADDIPPAYLTLYQQAAVSCPGLSWTVLAGIGKVESNHGRSTLPGVHSGANYAGAEGPMQFLPPTFAQYAHPRPGRTTASPYDPADAIPAAARMLCATGARNNRNLHAALWGYNHSESYIRDVLDHAARYRAIR